MTADPAAAAYFFVPLYTGQLAATSDSRRSARTAEVTAALAALAESAPSVWPARSRAHIFAATVDRGRCFQDDGTDQGLTQCPEPHTLP